MRQSSEPEEPRREAKGGDFARDCHSMREILLRLWDLGLQHGVSALACQNSPSLAFQAHTTFLTKIQFIRHNENRQDLEEQPSNITLKTTSFQPWASGGVKTLCSIPRPDLRSKGQIPLKLTVSGPSSSRASSTRDLPHHTHPPPSFALTTRLSQQCQRLYVVR